MPGVTIKRRSTESSRIDFDLADLLRTLGPMAIRSYWQPSEVECFGEGADELNRLSDEEELVTGSRLLELASKVDQTIDGRFLGFKEKSEEPWILIRAVDGEAFDVETENAATLRKLRKGFAHVLDMPDE